MTKAYTLLALGLIMPAAAAAASPFDGTWKTDPKTITQIGPDISMILKDGIYACILCANPRALPADGQQHALSGLPYADHGSVTVTDAHTVNAAEWKDGKQVVAATITVNPSGNNFTETGFFIQGASEPVHYSASATRIGAVMAGAHLISGLWQTHNINASDAAMTMTLATDGDRLAMKSPMGGSFTAPFDGTEAPFMGDPGITSVSIKRLSDTSYQETDKRNGTVIEVDTVTVSPDGKSLQVQAEDRLQGLKSSFTMLRQ